jgi:hypothetical protein
VVDLVALEERSGERPLAAGIVALRDEAPLACTDQQPRFHRPLCLAHHRLFCALGEDSKPYPPKRADVAGDSRPAFKAFLATYATQADRAGQENSQGDSWHLRPKSFALMHHTLLRVSSV